METLRKKLFEKGEPVRDKVIDYCYEQEVPTTALLRLTCLTKAQSGFNSVDKLKLIILALDVIEDMHLMGEVTGVYTRNSYYNSDLTSLRQNLIDMIPNLYKVVSTAKKYKNFNHVIKITYESKVKDKANA